jgi:hypothetical protein
VPARRAEGISLSACGERAGACPGEGRGERGSNGRRPVTDPAPGTPAHAAEHAPLAPLRLRAH